MIHDDDREWDDPIRGGRDPLDWCDECRGAYGRHEPWCEHAPQWAKSEAMAIDQGESKDDWRD